MSSKVVLAAAAVAFLASVDARIISGVPTPAWLMDEEEEEVQKLKLGKIVKGVHTGLNLYGKAKSVGLFDEEEEDVQKLKLGKIVKGINTGLDLFGKAKSVGLFEEGDNYWEVGGGASNGGNWNVNGKIGGKFDEDEEVQKLKLDLKKATTVITTANKMGLLEEDADMDEVQKLKLGKVIKGAVKVVKVAGAVGLLEEDEEFQKTNVLNAVDKALNLYGKAKQVGLFEEGDNYWEVGGGASNGGNWNIGGKIGGKFDEDEEVQKLKLGKIVKGVNTGLNLYGKAKSVGLFDEEQEAPVKKQRHHNGEFKKGFKHQKHQPKFTKQERF